MPFAFLALTGCRRREALGLRWGDVNLDCGAVSIRQTVMPLTRANGKGREGRIVARTKTDRARMIELDGSSVSMLRTWRARQAEERLAIGGGYQDLDLIFCLVDGRPYQPEAFSKDFRPAHASTENSTLPMIRLHDLRHTWATLALAGAERLVTNS